LLNFFLRSGWASFDVLLLGSDLVLGAFVGVGCACFVRCEFLLQFRDHGFLLRQLSQGIILLFFCLGDGVTLVHLAEDVLERGPFLRILLQTSVNQVLQTFGVASDGSVLSFYDPRGAAKR